MIFFVFFSVFFLYSNTAPLVMTEISELTELNQKLLDEISSLQIRMIDILKENFRVKAELDTLKRHLKNNSKAPIPFYVPRNPRKAGETSNTSRDEKPAISNVPTTTSRDPIVVEALSSKRSHSGDNLLQQVAEMDRIVGELERRTRIHEMQDRGPDDIPGVATVPAIRQGQLTPLTKEAADPSTPNFSLILANVQDIVAKAVAENNKLLPQPTNVNMTPDITKSPSEDDHRSVPPEDMDGDLPTLVPHYRQTATMIQAIKETPVMHVRPN